MLRCSFVKNEINGYQEAIDAMKKSVIMVGGGVQEAPAVRRIKKLNYNVIVTDMNPNAPAFKEADISVNINAMDVQSLISWILLNKKRLNISGIFTLINQAPTVALVASATGLPSLPVDVAISCDNKLLMKRKFKEHRLPTAEFFEVSSLGDAELAFDKLKNKSVFLKAVDSFGGRGIRKIKNLNDLEEAYSSIRQISKFPFLILEERLEGYFIDAQGIFSDGKFYRAGICDSFFSNEIEGFKEYNPVEIFNVSPSQQSDAVVNDDVYQLLEKAARSLGVNWGPVGGDFILTDSGLKIIEIAPRLHGPNGSLQIFPASTGIQPLEFMVQCIAGDNPNPEYLKPKSNKVALCKVFISSKQDIKEIKFKTDPQKLEGLFSWFIYWNKNEKIVRSQTTLSGLASVFVSGEDYEEAMRNLKIVEDEFEIK